MTTPWIDLSQALDDETPLWPGNPPVAVEWLRRIPAELGPGERAAPDASRRSNVSAFYTCCHTGTHMDAPLHFYNGVRTIDQVPLDRCAGPCALVDVGPKEPREPITIDDLRSAEGSIARCRKVLVHTGWSTRWGLPEYFHEYPPLAVEAAEWLVERGVGLVGVDTPSVDYAPNPVHYVLLGADAVIVENLCRLDRIGAPVFELVVAPLKLTGRDGSPVRAIARVLASPSSGEGA